MTQQPYCIRDADSVRIIRELRRPVKPQRGRDFFSQALRPLNSCTPGVILPGEAPQYNAGPLQARPR